MQVSFSILLRARVGIKNIPAFISGVDDCEDWDSDYQREIIEDVSVSDDDDSIVDSDRKAWREYCASIFRKRFGPMGVRRDELLSDESDCEDTSHVAGRQYLDVPDGMDLMRPTAHRLSRSELTVDVETKPHVDKDPDDPDQLDIGHDVRSLPDTVPALFDMTTAVPLALPVVIQTRPQVGCDPYLPLPLPLPVDEGQEWRRWSGRIFFRTRVHREDIRCQS